MIAVFLEKIGHVDAVRVVVLAEAQAGGRRESATGDVERQKSACAPR